MSEIPNPSAGENVRQVTTNIEIIKPKVDHPLPLKDVVPIETRGDFSRVATFGIGLTVTDNGEYHNDRDVDSDDADDAVILDVWTRGDEVYALPRSVVVDDSQEIPERAWDLTKGSVSVGLNQRDAWEEKTGQKLPDGLSKNHFAVGLEGDVLHFVDFGSANGSRIKTASFAPPSDLDMTPELTTLEPLHLEPESGAAPAQGEIPGVEGLWGMGNTAAELEQLLASKPTMTSSKDLHTVAETLDFDAARLVEMQNGVGSSPEIDEALGALIHLNETIRSGARTVANGIEAGYGGEGQVHESRREVERQLAQYQNELNVLYRTLGTR